MEADSIALPVWNLHCVSIAIQRYPVVDAEAPRGAEHVHLVVRYQGY